jgi:cell division protein FtsQ
MAVTPNNAIEERRREIEMKRKAKRAKQRKAALKRFFIFLCIAAVITLVILSFTVFFPVQKITVVSGSAVYTNQEIIKASGVKVGENLWMTGFSAEKDMPVKLPYVEKAEVQRKFPSTVVIKTTPAKAEYCFFVEKDFYICDKNYKVLEVKKEQDKNLVSVLGTDAQKTKAGRKISFTDPKKQETVEKIFAALKERSIAVNSVDVTKVVDIKFSIEGRLNVSFGSMAHFDSKLAHLAEMVKNSQKDVKASIDLSEYTPENGRAILKRE